MAAVSDQEVGIDVEKVCVQSDSVLKAVLTEKEYATIVNIPEQDDFFVRYWTIKESYVKLLGQGLPDSSGDTWKSRRFKRNAK